jgi:hypothetical protein
MVGVERVAGFGDSELCEISLMAASTRVWGRKVMARMAASACGE